MKASELHAVLSGVSGQSPEALLQNLIEWSSADLGSALRTLIETEALRISDAEALTVAFRRIAGEAVVNPSSKRKTSDRLEQQGQTRIRIADLQARTAAVRAQLESAQAEIVAKRRRCQELAATIDGARLEPS
jgi:hypothetical protein